LLADGAMRLPWAGHRPEHARVVLTAIGAYQLGTVLQASARLVERDVEHAVVVMIEPGRFRLPRSREAASPTLVDALYPPTVLARVFVTHTRPESMLGVLAPLGTGAATIALGYTSAGGTLDVEGLFFVNGCSWAHCLDAVARVTGVPRERLLTEEERAALDRRRSPDGIITARRL
jgi:phosphoketolase